MLEKNNRCKKKLAVSRKLKIGNYRIEYYKQVKDSNIGSVCVGCYLGLPLESNLSTIGAVLRHYNHLWVPKLRFLSNWGVKQLIFVPDIPESILDRVGYCEFTIQFKLDDLNTKMDECVYDLILDIITELIDESKLDMIDK